MMARLRNTLAPRGNGRQCRSRSSFTLVELLVVIGILGVLLVIALPAFTGIGQGTRARTAVTELKFTLQLARQWAITHRKKTFVVFPTSNFGTMTNIAYQAYAVCTTNEFLREWSFLPPGVLFDGRPFATKNLLVLSNYRETTSLFSNQPAVAFGADGSITRKSTDPEIFLTEGFLNGTTPVYRPGAVTNGVQIYRFTGMPQISRYDQ